MKIIIDLLLDSVSVFWYVQHWNLQIIFNFRELLGNRWTCKIKRYCITIAAFLRNVLKNQRCFFSVSRCCRFFWTTISECHPDQEWRCQITKSPFKGNSLLSEATRTSSADLGQHDTDFCSFLWSFFIPGDQVSPFVKLKLTHRQSWE